MTDILPLSCPGRCAARSDALQNRDPNRSLSNMGPASAVHRYTLHRVRDTRSRHD
jgi:hypothetical protein